MTINTLKDFGQSGNSVKIDKLNNFLLEELDDAASDAVNGGQSGNVWKIQSNLEFQIDTAKLASINFEIGASVFG